jgi:hypothetical protein
VQSLCIAGKEGGAAPTINVAQTINITQNTAQNMTQNMNNSTDGGGTPEWAKRQGREQQFQGGLLRELHEWMTNEKAPPSENAAGAGSSPPPHTPSRESSPNLKSNVKKE